MRVPDVQVADLRSFGCGDADDRADGCVPGDARARRQDERLFGALFAGGGGDVVVKGCVWVED